ncbi:MAG: potassium-transporting ATPase subunit C [Thermoplasmataceae archaeon]|jgi:K+-transporting ATPase ATPase C chain
MKKSNSLSVPIRIALISLVACGLLFPGVVTGIAQLAMPVQANGSLISFNNTTIGSSLIAQEFNYSGFFHPRNDSASGLDPDITVQNATLQAARIHNVTGISIAYLDGIIKENTKYTLFFFGTAYVNVLDLNINLAEHYPSIYDRYTL